MSELPENEKEISGSDIDEVKAEKEAYTDEYAQFETIFSQPQEKDDKKPKKSSSKRQIKTVIASVLALCVLIGTTVAVVKLIPEKQEENATSNSLYNDFSIVDYKADDVSSVTVTNQNGTFKFLPEKSSEATSDGESNTVWYIDGIEKDAVNSDQIKVIVEAAASILAKRTITEKTASECGFDEPKYTATVSGEGFDDYTVYVGSESPDQTGTYVMTSSTDEIYLVYGTGLTSFDFEVTDLATTDKIPAVTFKTSVSSYYGDDGVLASFDTLTLSGKKFAQPIVFAPNGDALLATYIKYVVSSDGGREANGDRVTPIFKFFSEGLTVVGAYAYDVSDASIAKYGLNDPDAVVTISVGGEKKQFKISAVDETYCAVIYDGATFIRKVALDDVAFMKYTPNDFYSSFVFLRAIADTSNVTFEFEGNSYSFDIKENPEGSAEECTVTYNGNQITASYFQNLYQALIGITAADYDTQILSKEPDMTVKFTDASSGEVNTIRYTKVTATKYQYSVNGKDIGRVVSSEYNRIVKYVKNVANNKDIK